MLSTPGQLQEAGRIHWQVQCAGKDGLRGRAADSEATLALLVFLPIKPTSVQKL